MSANARTFGSALTLNDPTHAFVDVTLTDYSVAVAVDSFASLHTNVDLSGYYSQQVATALAKAYDTAILTTLNGWDALSATTPNVLTTGDVLNSVIEASTTLTGLDVDMDGRILAIKASYLANVLKNTQATSADFASVKALVNGEINAFMGFKWITLPDTYFTDANTVAFAFHKSALGVATALEPTVMVERNVHIDADQILGKMSIGSAIVDKIGIVEINAA